MTSTLRPTSAAEVYDKTTLALARPQEMLADKSRSLSSLAALLKPVDVLFRFRGNTSQTLLDVAIGTDFTGHTLPPGRPQVRRGLTAASKAFPVAGPDLKVAVTQRLAVGDRVVSHPRFTRHFIGSLMGHRGAGQSLGFIATDIARVAHGRLSDDQHLEDGLTFQRQIGSLPSQSPH